MKQSNVINEEYGRVLPYSKEYEKALIVALLNSSIKAKDIIDIIPDSDYFYFPDYANIYNVIVHLTSRRIPIDILTVFEEFKKKGEGEKYSAYFIMKLANETILPISPQNYVNYAHTILGYHSLRELIKLAHEMTLKAYSKEDPNEIIYDVNKKISQLAINSTASYKHIAEVLMVEYDEISQDIHKEITFNGVDTGFEKLNLLTGGWQKGDLIIIAARPSMGKTQLALNFAYHASEHKNVLFCSLEMGNSQLTRRLISMSTGINLNEVMHPYLIKDKSTGLSRISNDTELQNRNLYLDDNSGLEITSLRYKSMQLKKEKGLDMIIIDYLQLMRGDKRSGNREQEIATISRELKILAKELGIPIIALSQLNRGVENRTNKTPQLSDIRESGAIEQDADLVAFLYRPEAYGITQDENGDKLHKGSTDIVVSKHRNGKLDTVRLYGQMAIQKFHEQPFEDIYKWENNTTLKKINPDEFIEAPF